MKPHYLPILFGSLLAAHQASAHSWKASDGDKEALRAHILADWQRDHGQKHSATPQFAAIGDATNVGKAPSQASHFTPFAPKVQVKWDNDFLYIESNGVPSHNMMVGITAWQQQVPLPQSYTGDNAWRLPLKPVVAKTPQIVENHFLRGAIAIGVNGIPIFNPQNNRGEVSYEIGELDQWGGHCGRADDYHYHIAPLHLESVVGKGKPVAYALDGYPIYGLTEPDGSPLATLDECHGHDDSKIGYHYHASTKRPYLQCAFHGEVVEADGQVDPQPRAQGVREALQALRGAKITGFESTGANSYKLSYDVNGDKRSVAFSINADGTYPFEFDNGREGKTKEVYTKRRGPPPGPQLEGGGGPGGKGKGKGGKGGKGGPGGRGRPDDNPPPRPQGDDRPPPRPESAGANIMDANGDGVVSAVEFAEATKRKFAQGGQGSLADALQRAREQFTALDHNKDGQLDRPELDELASNDVPQGNRPPRGNEPPPRGEMNRDGRREGGGGEGGRGGKKEGFVESPDQPRSSNGSFLLTSSATEDLKEMPAEYTGDGEAATLPLEWKSAPAGTQSYALIMDHSDPEGQKKWYWTVYDIPASVTSFPKNVQGIGKVGTGFKGQIGYEPPHSRGPGAKTYVLTMYALSAPLNLTQSPREVNREVLIQAMKGKVLASSSLRVVHTSKGNEGPGGGGEDRPRREGERPRSETAMNDRPPPRGDAPQVPGGLRPLDNIFEKPTQVAQNTVKPAEAPPARPEGGKGGKDGPGGKGGGKGGPDNKGLIKPAMTDTIKVNVYADNWFMLYINGKLTAVDSIDFIPHNVVSVDILPEYPMTIAVMAKDNADAKTGMEYGDHIGDGGFIIKFADGTVSNASWKAKSFFKGPLNHDAVNPKAEHTAIPDNWFAIDFDDSKWANATEYTEERVNPKAPYYDADFAGAKFIWSEDLDLDNTIIFRTKIDKPGWAKRWNTKPDLDVRGAPLK